MKPVARTTWFLRKVAAVRVSESFGRRLPNRFGYVPSAASPRFGLPLFFGDGRGRLVR